MTQAVNNNILALDVGAARVGVAFANGIARLARPLTALDMNDRFWQELATIVRREEVGHIVVGLPRNLAGEDTAQTASVRQFAETLVAEIAVPMSFQDEALTSRQAEDELRQRGVRYTKGDIDALAATYILNDYLGEQH